MITSIHITGRKREIGHRNRRCDDGSMRLGGGTEGALSRGVRAASRSYGPAASLQKQQPSNTVAVTK